MIIVFANNSVT